MAENLIISGSLTEETCSILLRRVNFGEVAGDWGSGDATVGEEAVVEKRLDVVETESRLHDPTQFVDRVETSNSCFRSFDAIVG